MKSVSIQELKGNLSGYLELAARGEDVVVTKHRRPWAKLSAIDSSHVHEGKRFGRIDLSPVLRTPLPAEVWKWVADDRAESTDRES